MIYLIAQTWIALLAAFGFGLAVGWLWCGRKCRRKATDAPVTSAIPLIPQDVDEGEVIVSPLTDGPVNLDTKRNLDSNDFQIETLEGIGRHTGQLFRNYDICTVGDYLRQLRTPAQRAKAATQMGIKIEPLNDWAGMADLLRLDGMDAQSAELIYRSGVLNVEQLASSNGKALLGKLVKTNEAGTQLIAPEVPASDILKQWISEAKRRNQVVSF